MVNLADEPMLRLQFKPLQPGHPELIRIAGEQNRPARLGYTKAFAEQSLPAHLQGRSAVLDACHHIEGTVAETQSHRIHSQKVAVRSTAAEFSGKVEAGRPGIDAHGAASLLRKLGEDPAIPAPQFQDRITRMNPSEDMLDFGLKVLADAGRGYLVAQLQSLSGKLLRVISGHTPYHSTLSPRIRDFTHEADEAATGADHLKHTPPYAKYAFPRIASLPSGLQRNPVTGTLGSRIDLTRETAWWQDKPRVGRE